MKEDVKITFWKIKRNFKLFLLESSNLFYAIVLLLAWTAIRRFFLTSSFRNDSDYFTSIFYFLTIAWVYYTTCYRLILDEDTNEKVILKRRLDDIASYKISLIQLSILFMFGTRSFIIYGQAGIIIILSIITVTALLSILYLFYDSRKQFSEIIKNKFKGNFIESIINAFAPILIYGAIIVYVLLWPWRTAFCHQYGVEEIGHYFEKDSYEAKYLVKISRVDGDNTYTLPSEIFVSKDFSEYDSYETTRGVGAYSTDEEESVEIRYVKIKKVFFKNGGFLYFDCLVPVENSQTCEDQDGEEWEIELTSTKIK
jgi:hypothetical protein